MFVSFLEPYPVRGVEAPYLWVFYKQIMHFEKRDIFFIGSEKYFQDPAVFKNRSELNEYAQYKNEYEIPDIHKIQQYKKAVIDENLYKPLEEKLKNKTEIFRYLLLNEYEPLVKRLEDIFSGLEDIEAVLAWVNSPSLNKAAENAGIKVIYNELGPFRKPAYKQFAYFDFSGVNGNTESKKRFEKFCKEDIECFKIDEIREIIYKDIFIPQKINVYKAGVALQVEDDSNILAYSNGYDSLKLINEVLFYYDKKDVLIRKHPLGIMEINDKTLNVDDSKNSIEFINKCEKIITINSSVGMEALLFEKDVYAKGDSPYSFFVSDDLSENAYEKDKLKEFLNFFVFSYLIPYELLYNPEYYRFRLKNPSESEIFNYHKKIILNNEEENVKEKFILKKYKNIKEELEYIKKENRHLKNSFLEKNEVINKQQKAIEEKNRLISDMKEALEEKNVLIKKLYDKMEEKQELIEEKNRKIETLFNILEEKNRKIKNLEHKMKELDRLKKELNKTVAKVRSYENEIIMYCTSDSWKITRPLRKIMKKIKGK